MKIILLSILLSFLMTATLAQFQSEKVGNPSTNTIVSAYTGWVNQGILTFSGNADVQTLHPSNNADGSGGGNVFFTNTPGKYFKISGFPVRRVARHSDHRGAGAAGAALGPRRRGLVEQVETDSLRTECGVVCGRPGGRAPATRGPLANRQQDRHYVWNRWHGRHEPRQSTHLRCAAGLAASRPGCRRHHDLAGWRAVSAQGRGPGARCLQPGRDAGTARQCRHRSCALPHRGLRLGRGVATVLRERALWHLPRAQRQPD